jgi:hypothetical protein
MARSVGSWWIKDGIDGRRIEAQGFASLLDPLSGFEWTHDHGDGAVLKKDFVETPSYTEHTDEVDAIMMSTHGWTDGFLTSDGDVRTSDDVNFGKVDLEIFATHACDLLEHSNAHPVGRWIPAFERLHYMFGFHNSSYSGGGQDPRGTYFAMYAAWLERVLGISSYTLRDSWRLANTLVEGSGVQWAYLRATSPTADTYNEKLTTSEPSDPVVGSRTFWTNRGSC